MLFERWAVRQWENQYDAARIRKVFEGKSVNKKILLLHYVMSEWDDWDVFPAHSIINGLEDTSPVVRAWTIEVLCSLGQGVVPQSVILQMFRMVEDIDPLVRDSVLEFFNQMGLYIENDCMVNILPYFVHRDTFVRETALQVLDTLEHIIRGEWMSLLVNLYHEEQSASAKKSLGEFLQMHGHGSSLD